MPEGRIYMTDTTAEALGGREHVEAIYERIGDGGHIVIHSPLDTEEQVEFLFLQAQIFSGADPLLVEEGEIADMIESAHDADSPSFRSFNIDNRGPIDIGSYRYLPEYFEAETLAFPGNVELVRDFITAHELGHYKPNGRGGDDFWHVWQSETNADQDAFRGMGESATLEFQRSILAARAGNALHLHGVKLAFGSGDYIDNQPFVHASVLGTFLPGETPYEITEERLNNAINGFREQIAIKIHDNHVAQNPDYELDISILSDAPLDRDDVESNIARFNNFLEEQDFVTASLYAQFRQNLNTLSGQMQTLDRFYEITGNDDMAFGNIDGIEDGHLFPMMEQTNAEYQQALSFMRETQPELFREYIAQNHPDLITTQTGFISEDGPVNFYDNNRRLGEVVMQLHEEGAFDDDPIQKRLADYIAIDMEIRPNLYNANENPAPEADQDRLSLNEATRTPAMARS